MVLPPPDINSVGIWNQAVNPIEAAEPLFRAEVPPPFEVMIQDGERLVGARVPDYGVGKVALTTGSNIVTRLSAWIDDNDVITYAATNPGGTNALYPPLTPVFGKWLEGRQIVFANDPHTYLVIAVLDLNLDTFYDAMYVARGENGLPPGGYSTGDLTYTVLGWRNRLFFSAITTLGIFPEQWPLENTLDLDMQGDEIMALCHAGEFLLVVGRQVVVYLLQNHGAIDDVPATGPPYSNPRFVYGCPGCQARRSVAQLPNNTAMWLSPAGKIAIATAAGVQQHPLSEMFRGWVSSQDKIDTDKLTQSHACYIPLYQWYVLFLVEDKNTTQTNTEGGLEYWPQSVPVDPFNGGFTEATDKIPPLPIELSITTLGCDYYGNSINSDTPLTNDYSHILILDNLNKVIYIGWGWKISCTLAHSSPCASLGLLPEYAMGGGIDGYISKLFGDDCYGLGTPNNRVKWPVTGASTSLQIDDVALGEFFQDNALIGLTLIIHFLDGQQPAHFEVNVCSANNNNTIDLTTPITDYDSVDYVLIAPMFCGLVFGEKRTTMPSTILQALIDVLDTQEEQQQFYMDILGATGNNNTVAFNGPTVTREFNTTDLKQGQGSIQLPQLAAKALALGIRFHPTGAGSLQLGPITIDQYLAPGEKTRSEVK